MKIMKKTTPILDYLDEYEVSIFTLNKIYNRREWIRDDFNLEQIPWEEMTIFVELDKSKSNASVLNVENYFPDSQKENEYSLLAKNHLYRMEEVILSKDIEPYMVHYIISAFDNSFSSLNTEEKMLFEKLTDREKQVLSLMARGYSMTSIAEKLILSPHTINSHRTKLCSKLGVRRTTELAIWAYRFGLVSGKSSLLDKWEE